MLLLLYKVNTQLADAIILNKSSQKQLRCVEIREVRCDFYGRFTVSWHLTYYQDGVYGIRALCYSAR